MMADTHQELMTMAKRLRLKEEWLQKKGSRGEHFDLTPRTRERAVGYGAVEISARELIGIRNQRKGEAGKQRYFEESVVPSC